jgi:hypothetical protein
LRVESHGLDQIVSDLRTADAEIGRKVAKVTGMALNLIKKDAQRRVRGFPHLPHLARSFNYDVTTTRTSVVGEVGADHDKLQGKLDAYIEDGTPTSAPIPHWRPAADKELPVWQRYLDDVAAEALDDR